MREPGHRCVYGQEQMDARAKTSGIFFEPPFAAIASCFRISETLPGATESHDGRFSILWGDALFSNGRKEAVEAFLATTWVAI